MIKNYKDTDIYKCFKNSRLHSSKGNTYFYAHEELFSKFKGKNVTFVEIRVEWGGSLLMWKELLGKEARVIGEYLNQLH